MPSFWDDPEVAVSSSFVKFDSVGDEVAGTISRLGKKVWGDGSVAVEILFREDDVPTLTAGQTLLRQALFQLKPGVGDHLRVRLVKVDRLSGGKTLKRFRVELKAEDGKSEVIDQSEDQSEPAF